MAKFYVLCYLSRFSVFLMIMQYILSFDKSASASSNDQGQRTKSRLQDRDQDRLQDQDQDPV